MTHRPVLTVFCGSSGDVDEIYRDAAVRLGKVMGQAGLDLVFGGGHVGLMGLLADSALAAGSRVVGIIPGFLRDRELAHPDVHELIVTGTMHERKQQMYDRANAFVSLPGGLGTFDETIEVMTWTQLGLSRKPVILVNVNDYWQPFISLVQHAIQSGFASARHETILSVVASPDDVPSKIPAITYDRQN